MIKVGATAGPKPLASVSPALKVNPAPAAAPVKPPALPPTNMAALNQQRLNNSGNRALQAENAGYAGEAVHMMDRNTDAANSQPQQHLTPVTDTVNGYTGGGLW